MCVHPIFIENKNRATALSRTTKSGAIRVVANFAEHDRVSKYKDITGHYIPVGCGTCYECRTLRQNYKTQRFAMEALQSDFYFCTLTYNDEHLPVMTLKADGETIFTHSIPNVSHLQNFFKRIRKRNIFGKQFRYFVASEYGGKNHRAHYHILFSVPKDTTKSIAEKTVEAVKIGKDIQKEWSINVGTRKNPVYQSLFTYAQKWQGGKRYCNYDFHYVKPQDSGSVEDVYYYVSKYILKADKHVAKCISKLRHLIEDDSHLYTMDISSPAQGTIASFDSEDNLLSFEDDVVSVFKPFSLCSKHFGLPFVNSDNQPINNIITDYIKRCIKQCVRDSQYNIRSWFSIVLPNLGTTVPMSPYYWKRFADFEDYSTINENLRATTKLMLDLGEDVPVYFTDYDNYRSYVEPTPEDIEKDFLRLNELHNRISDINLNNVLNTI